MGDRQFYTLVYILFLVIVIGGFAAMAQNDYGAILIAIGCFGFSIIFLTRLLGINNIPDSYFPTFWIKQEHVFMSLILGLFGLRALRIRFDFVEIVFVIASLFMILIYVRYLVRLRKNFKLNPIISTSVSLLYVGLILFFLSMSITFISQVTSVGIGVASFMFLAGFIIWNYWKGPNTILNNEKVRIFPLVTGFKNLSVIISTIILFMSIYMGLNKANLIPPLYTGELPVRFIDLQQQSLNGELDPINGEEKYNIYWDEYQEFLKYMKEKEE